MPLKRANDGLDAPRGVRRSPRASRFAGSAGRPSHVMRGRWPAQLLPSSSKAMTACHSSGLTGVMDSRLPGWSTRMLASAACWRISARLIRRVLRTKLTSTCSQRGASGLDLGSK